MDAGIPEDLREAIARITAKRPRTVLEHILQHGHITTQELRDQYGYNHPPRAARDVREQGIPLKTTKVRGSDGRSIAAYELDVEGRVEARKSGGRRAVPKRVKQALMEATGSICAICQSQYPAPFLQVDHRVPFEVAGEELPALAADPHLLLCRACNRAKSWSCEHCANWTGARSWAACAMCYWAHPEGYRHIAMSEERRVEIVVRGKDVEWFDRLTAALRRQGISVQSFALESIRRRAKR